jgi:glycosyltransferase involved in cell wall biosynthesis
MSCAAGNPCVHKDLKPQRLLSIAHSYSVRLNRRLVREIAREGAGDWEVTAVAPSFFRGDFGADPMQPQQEDECFRLVPLKVYLSGRIHLMFYSAALQKLLREGWDLVHCWEEPYIVAAAQIAWLTPRKVPLVFWTAQSLPKRYPPPFCWFEMYCLRRCAGWMTCGQSVVNNLLPRGYGAKPHRIIPLGVDLDLFRADPAARDRRRAELGWRDAEPPVIGYLGRFVRDKGLEVLMEVLTNLTVPWRALFVGSGPMEEELRRWSSKRNDRVRIVTGVKHEMVPSYLNAMDLLCAPSQTSKKSREQFGRMLVEAFACEVPVIASDCGEMPYVVGDAGIIVGERDVAGWRASVERLILDPAERRVLARRGRVRAEGRFAWPVIARQYIEFFEERRCEEQQSCAAR